MPSSPDPCTPVELGEHVIGAIDRFLEQRRAGSDKNRTDLKQRLLRMVQRVEPTFAFEALLWILETQTRYQHQLVAGELLQLAAMDCPLELNELLPRVLPRFNASANTVAFYIRDRFGKESVLAALQELESRHGGPVPAGSIMTMRYWMGAP